MAGYIRAGVFAKGKGITDEAGGARRMDRH